jgi:hypothetical protein
MAPYLAVHIESMSVTVVSTSACAGDILGRKVGHAQGHYHLLQTRLMNPFPSLQSAHAKKTTHREQMPRGCAGMGAHCSVAVVRCIIQTCKHYGRLVRKRLVRSWKSGKNQFFPPPAHVPSNAGKFVGKASKPIAAHIRIFA